MRSINTQAAQVAVWLGPAADHSDLAIDRLNERFSSTGQPIDVVSLWTKVEAEAILELCQRRYWRRIWIIQEVVLGKKAIFYCGEKSLEGVKLAAIFERLEHLIANRGHRSTFLHRLIDQSDASSLIRQRTYRH
jgi:hypothetical protein